jgi:predicted GNAT superfamily acetyltransferase
MDFYSDNGGEWTNYFHKKRDQRNRGVKLDRKIKKEKIELEIEEKNTVINNFNKASEIVQENLVQF